MCRTLFAAGAEGARAHEEAFFAYLEDNFDDDSGEVRSVDVRDRKVGHFGNWMERTGHGERKGARFANRILPPRHPTTRFGFSCAGH